MVKHTAVPHLFLALLLLLSSASRAEPGPIQVPSPSRSDTCPVCGMFVAKYSEWAATVLYDDGHAHHFDGAKDLFKYLLDLPRYAPGHRVEQISAIAVTEYYGLKRIDARSAWYVIGSDVLGPMGHELVPLASEADAQAFLQDHQGGEIVRFADITLQMLADLEKGS